MINGTAPATAWVGNLAAVAIRPLTTLAGSVPIGVATGNWKNLQRSLTAFGQLQETLRRASKMARDEWKFVNSLVLKLLWHEVVRTMTLLMLIKMPKLC